MIVPQQEIVGIVFSNGQVYHESSEREKENPVHHRVVKQ